MGVDPEQELREKVHYLSGELERVEKEVKEYGLVRTGIGYAAFGVLMFFHLSGWLESHHVLGYRQWFYIIPFFIAMFLLLLWLMHESIQIDKIFKRKK